MYLQGDDIAIRGPGTNTTASALKNMQDYARRASFTSLSWAMEA